MSRPDSVRRASALLLPIIYLGFVSLGLPDGTWGAAWPSMHRELGLPIGLAGTLTLVGTLLAALSGFASGRVIGRFGTGPVTMVSCAMTGAALLTIANASGFGWLMGATALLGFGAGAVDAGLNGYVARHYSGRHMNWLHACWGVGATAGPIVMGSMIAASGGWRGGYVTIGAVQLTLAAVLALTLGLWAAVPERKVEAVAGEAPRRIPTLTANSPAGWLSAAIFAIYVAVETTAGIWAASVLVEVRSLPPATAAVCVAAYYGSITGGRVLAGVVVDRWGNRRMVRGGLLLAVTGAVLFAVGGPAWLSVVALAMTGLGFAPIYPCLMHEVPRRFAPGSVATVIGRQSGAAYLGAASMPAAAGILAEQSLAGIPWLVAGGIVVLILAVLELDRRS